MKKVILYISQSLDGYLAATDHRMDWLEGDGSDPTTLGTYPSFYETVDTIVMGWKTYDLIDRVLSPGNWPYPNKKSYILTHRTLESSKDIIFSSEDLELLIQKLTLEKGKNIWICGGANLVKQLLELDLIDEIHITIVPIILGDGINLFTPLSHELRLKLIESKSYNGFVDLVYTRR